MKPSEIKPIDLLNDTKVYQFIKQTTSENRTSKLVLKEDLRDYQTILKAIERAMNIIKKRRSKVAAK